MSKAGRAGVMPAAGDRVRHWGGIGLVLLSATGFGVMAPMARFAYAGGANVQTIGAVRFLVAGALLWLLAAATGRIRPLPRAKQLQLALMGGIGYTLHSGLFFNSVRFISPGLAGVILYVYPALVVLLSAVVFRERLGPLRLLAVALCTGGAALAASSGGSGAVDLRGVGLVVAAACVYSTYIVLSRPVLAGVDPVLATAWVVTFSGVSYSLIAVLSGTFTYALTPAGWGAISVIALFSTFVAILCFFLGIERIGPAATAVVSSFEPVATILLAMLLLAEFPAPVQWLGTALVLGGVVLQAVAPAETAAPAQPEPAAVGFGSAAIRSGSATDKPASREGC